VQIGANNHVVDGMVEAHSLPRGKHRESSQLSHIITRTPTGRLFLKLFQAKLIIYLRIPEVFE